MLNKREFKTFSKNFIPNIERTVNHTHTHTHNAIDKCYYYLISFVFMVFVLLTLMYCYLSFTLKQHTN